MFDVHKYYLTFFQSLALYCLLIIPNLFNIILLLLTFYFILYDIYKILSQRGGAEESRTPDLLLARQAL